MPDLSALAGCEVRRVQLDYQVTLLLVDGPMGQERVAATLVMEQSIHLAAQGQELVVEPGRKETLGPILRVLRTTVTNAAASDDGVLTMTFNDGSSLTTGPHPDYESWHLFGQGVPQVLIGPS